MTIEKEDESFWLEEVKGIKPSSKNSKPILISSKKIEIKEHQHYAVKQEFTSYSKDIDDDAFGGIDKATLRKFKREEFKIEAILDLHGLTEDDAFEKVDNFIPQSYSLGKRCIVIITGKGLSVHEDEDIFANKGLLKQRVPQWLNMPRLRGMILVYKHPSERLGGSGALYILLKRNKEF